MLELGFKDGKQMKFAWTERAKRTAQAEGGQGEVQKKEENQTQLADIVEEVERHSRILGRKDELQG